MGANTWDCQFGYMKRNRLYLSGSALFAWVITTSAASAADLQTAAGNWHLAGIFTPSALREAYHNPVTGANRQSLNSDDFAKNGEELVDLFFAGGFSTQSGEITLASGGAISGAFSGSATLTSSKAVTAVVGGSLPSF